MVDMVVHRHELQADARPALPPPHQGSDAASEAKEAA